MVTREEHDTRERFRDRYREDRSDVVLQIERSVIGGDWGANGYTTLSQADQLADALRLAPGVQLLDLGAGRWLARPVPGGPHRMPGGAKRRAARRPSRGGGPSSD